MMGPAPLGSALHRSEGNVQVTCDIDSALLERGSFTLTPQLRSLLRNYCRGLAVKLHLPGGLEVEGRFHKLNSTFDSRKLGMWLRRAGASLGQQVVLEPYSEDADGIFRVEVITPPEPEPEPEAEAAPEAADGGGSGDGGDGFVAALLAAEAAGGGDGLDDVVDPFDAMADASLDEPIFETEAFEGLAEALSGKEAPADAGAFALRHLAADAACRDGFTNLWGLDKLEGVELYEHQLLAVQKVLEEFHGRSILADEVGLGKTIEAGMVVSEYLRRGLIESFVVLAPASLVRQWQEELRGKFGIEATTHLDGDDWIGENFVVASLDTAKGTRHRKQVSDRKFDLVIVDEAHKLKNQRTRNWKFVRGLDCRYLLLLTATPIQNSIEELYNLIYLVRPGLLSTRKSFKAEFVHTRNRRVPRNVERLRELVGQVMVRSRRAEANIAFTDRKVDLIPVKLEGEEGKLYEKLDRFIRENYTHIPYFDKGMNRLTLMLLERMVTSSPRALAGTLSRLLEKGNIPSGFSEELRSIQATAEALGETAKAQAARKVVSGSDEKVLIYTQFRDSQESLALSLEAAGHKVFRFHGGLPVKAKDTVVKDFAKSDKGVLISTDAGAEGRNLQFCRRLINFDLPWNPMKVEQRIGRVHRLGQTRDVEIVNLYYEGSIEEYVVRLLTEKIRLFTLVVGELDSILGLAKTRNDIETEIMDVFMSTTDNEELDYRFDRLGRHFERAIEDYDGMKDAQNSIFEEGGASG